MKTAKQQSYGYDANGNLIYVNTGTKATDGKLKATNSRKLLWDEENRLLALSDNGFVSNYWYDASGERTVKESGDGQGVSVNGVLSGATTGTANFTAYVNPYTVVGKGGQMSKHIYIGSQRVVSKLINSGTMGDPTAQFLQVSGVNFASKYTSQVNQMKQRYDSLGVTYRGTDNRAAFYKSAGSTGSVAQQYFYHSDHLGSSSLITDIDGGVVQHLEYVPFGEVFIEERNNKWNTPYKFNAKELDEETGLYYYGARYYDPRTSVWLSVDPLAEKYYWITSYAYCLNNPVRFIDIDGRAPGDYFKSPNAAARDFGKMYNDNSIRISQEFGSTIYKLTNSKGKTGYTYTVPNIGTSGDAVTCSKAPSGTTAVADIHSHGSYSFGNSDDNHFSGVESNPTQNKASTFGDVGDNNRTGLIGFVTTPNGSLQMYDPNTGEVTQISSQMPSDQKDPTHLNTLGSAPSTTSYIVKKGDSLVSIAKSFATSAKAIIKENSLKTNIKAGQILNITN